MRWLRSSTAGSIKTGVYHSLLVLERHHVRAAVVELIDGAAQLLGVATAPVHDLGPTGQPDVDRLAAGCERALSEAEEMTRRAVGRKVVADAASISLPTPLASALAVSANRRRNARERISERELNSVVKRALRQAQDRLDAAGPKMDRDIVWGGVAETLVDGKIVLDPVGLHGSVLEVQACFATAPHVWVRALEVVAERLELDLCCIVPDEMALAAAVPDARALLVVLGQEHSQVAEIVRGRPRWVVTVPFGEQQVLGTIAKGVDFAERQVNALMRVYRARHLRPDVEERVALAYWKGLRRWMAALAEAIKEAYPAEGYPHRVWFVDTTRRMPEAENALAHPFWERALPFGRCPEVKTIVGPGGGSGAIANVLDCTAQATDESYRLARALARHAARVYRDEGQSSGSANLDRMLMEAVTPSAARR
ncbi:MAG: hypothetical protein ACP5G7_08745 [Anaerolineae bacterium]